MGSIYGTVKNINDSNVKSVRDPSGSVHYYNPSEYDFNGFTTQEDRSPYWQVNMLRGSNQRKEVPWDDYSMNISTYYRPTLTPIDNSQQQETRPEPQQPSTWDNSPYGNQNQQPAPAPAPAPAQDAPSQQQEDPFASAFSQYLEFMQEQQTYEREQAAEERERAAEAEEERRKNLEDQADRQRRAIEDARRIEFQDARNAFDASMDSFGTQVLGADIYDVDYLDYLANEITNLRRNATYTALGGEYGSGEFGGYVPSKTLTFYDAFPKLSSHSREISGLRSEREQAVADLLGQFSSTAGGINELDPWAEEDFQSVLNDLYGVRSQASRFTGGGVENRFSSAFDENALLVNNALDNIYDTRSGHEATAQDLLAQLRDYNFGDLADIDSYNAQVESLSGDVEQWSSNQAQDELAALASLLSGERSRLEADIAQKQEEERLAAEEMRRRLEAQMSGSAQAFLASNAPEEDDYYSSYNNSALARALGVI